jgi:membrane protease subunit (stomatin/prohibitin family)
MADVMEAAEPAEVTNTETAVVPYPVEAAMEAVSTMMAAVSTMMAAVSAMMAAVSAVSAVSAASRCNGRRESNDRGSDGKGDGRFSKHRSVSSRGHPPDAMLLLLAEAKLNIGSRMREVVTVRVLHACFRWRRQAGVSKS